MAHHTPGPWHATGNGCFINRYYADDEDELGGTVQIAQVRAADGDRQANAMLIAAAPLLLEALKALAVLEDFSEPVKPGDVITMPEDVTLINEAYAKAHAAIAKAEGKS